MCTFVYLIAPWDSMKGYNNDITNFNLTIQLNWPQSLPLHGVEPLPPAIQMPRLSPSLEKMISTWNTKRNNALMSAKLGHEIGKLMKHFEKLSFHPNFYVGLFSKIEYTPIFSLMLHNKQVHNLMDNIHFTPLLRSGGGGALEWQEGVSGSSMDTQKAP